MSAAAIGLRSQPDAAGFAVPSDATDCHIHVYDRRFPFDEAANLRPDGGTLEDYALLKSELGLARVVLVQPSSYGTDNRCLLEALDRLDDTGRGVAVVKPDISSQELERMDAAGVRGVRVNLARPGGIGVEDIRQLAALISALGWHLQVHATADTYPDVAGVLMGVDIDLVIDHLGRLPMPAGMTHPAADVIARLLDNGRCWIKLSGAYHDSRDPGRYRDTAEVARAWFDRAPERCVWGTDWPHPAAMAGEKPMPDDRALFELLPTIVRTEAGLRQVLVENPAKLYGFGVGADAE